MFSRNLKPTLAQFLFLTIFYFHPNSSALEASVRTSEQNTPLRSASVSRYLVFVPGYYGSKLGLTQTQETFFLSLRTAIFGSDQLFYSPRASSPKLYVLGILDRVIIVPGIYSIDGYGESLRRIRKNAVSVGIPEQNVLVFSYDWRADPISILKEFDRFVENLEDRSDVRPEISIVAHSMGAWLVSYWLRYGNQSPQTAQEIWDGLKRIKRTALFAAPFRGTLSVFRNSFWGAPGLPSPTLLSADKIASFPSTFYLAPSKADFYFNDGKPRSLFLRDPDLWIKQGWGLLQFPSVFSKYSAEEVHSFIRYHVSEAELFYKRLHAPVSKCPEDIENSVFNFQGKGVLTNELGIVISEFPMRFAFTKQQMKETKSKFYETEIDGDGTVSFLSSTPPSYFLELSHCKYTSFKFQNLIFEKSHLDILKNTSNEFWTSFFNH
jgi:hypothetical protein